MPAVDGALCDGCALGSVSPSSFSFGETFPNSGRYRYSVHSAGVTRAVWRHFCERFFSPECKYWLLSLCHFFFSALLCFVLCCFEMNVLVHHGAYVPPPHPPPTHEMKERHRVVNCTGLNRVVNPAFCPRRVFIPSGWHRSLSERRR